MNYIISPSKSKTAPPRRKSKRPNLPPESVCDSCRRELAIFWRGRAWCVDCDASQLFGVEAIAAHQARTGQIAREVGK